MKVQTFIFFKEDRFLKLQLNKIRYWKKHAKLNDSSLIIGKRIKEMFKTKDNINTKRIQHYFIEDEILFIDRSVSVSNSELSIFRVFGHESANLIQVEEFSSKVMLIEYEIPEDFISVDPIVRYFYKKPGFIGFLTSTTSISNTGVFQEMRGERRRGLRLIEKEIQELEKEAKFESVVSLYADTVHNTHQPTQEFLMKMLGSNFLSTPIKSKLVDIISEPKLLKLCYTVTTKEVQNKIVVKIQQLEDYISSPQEKRDQKLNFIELERYKREVSNFLDSKFANLSELRRQKLGKIFVQIRRGTYSERCKPPQSYQGVICHSLLDGNSVIVKVLPSQFPFEEKRVQCDKEVRLIYPLGSLFVAWLSLERLRHDNYVSFNSTLLYLNVSMITSDV